MEKVEYYTIRPNLKQIYGKKVTKDTEFTDKTEEGFIVPQYQMCTLEELKEQIADIECIYNEEVTEPTE